MDIDFDPNDLIRIIESSRIAIEEASYVRETAIASVRSIVRSNGMSVDEIQTEWGVDSNFANLVTSSEDLPQLTAGYRVSREFAELVRRDPSMIASGFWMSRELDRNTVEVSGSFRQKVIDRWNRKADDIGIQISWLQLGQSQMELFNHLWKISQGVGGPQIEILSMRLSDVDAVVGVADNGSSVDLWRKRLPSWIVLESLVERR